ncbi:MAG: diguanylate cyclase [Spirochaetales bacterium]|jgi:diguanylate cyclase (GGDEF)-like protein|nr:diguanylate cyclase [Spirochaetales bacterium]
MSDHDTTDILLTDADPVELEKLRESLAGDFLISVCSRPGDASRLMREGDIRIVVYSPGAEEGEALEFVRYIRNSFFQEPVQIIAFAADGGEAKSVLDYGCDDFVLQPFSNQELRARLDAAIFRLRSQIRVYGERNFFKKAAKQEEELSSKILDQHLVLKEAFQNIENINQELEEANKQLEQVARYDVLSGMLNRVSLFAALDTEIERSTRTGSPLSGIMMDMDNFKEINDTYGHLHGDSVIAEIGLRLKGTLRKYDYAGRYGGEEFYMILPNSTLQQAYLIAERFRKQLEESPVEFSGDKITITASFGIAQYRIGETREDWIARSDSYMYHAKETGRNRVVSEDLEK